jgi:hypothetical protein
MLTPSGRTAVVVKDHVSSFSMPDRHTASWKMQHRRLTKGVEFRGGND